MNEEEVYKPNSGEVFNPAKSFLDDVKKLIEQAITQNKKVEYYNEEGILILSLKDDVHGVYEVYNLKESDLIPKLYYVGDKMLRMSYLLNLINKEENKLETKHNYR